MGPLQLKYQLPLLLLLVASSFFIYLKRTPPMDTSTGTQLRKMCVTGSNGSVGKRVVLRALALGYHVVGVDYSALATADDFDPGSNSSFSFLQADLRDYNETLKAGTFRTYAQVAAVIHLAAYRQPGDYKVLVHNSNVVISWNVLRAAAELGINRIAQASSVNAITLVYSQEPKFEIFPIDETHPTLPDEPYGLSKVIMELQAALSAVTKDMRVASLRLHWSVPSRAFAAQNLDHERAKNDLWGYIQEDSGAEAFPTRTSEAFFIAAPETTYDGETSELIEKYWPNVPLKEGKTMNGNAGFFDCTKAKELLGWAHNPNLGAGSSN
ncbi:NAD-binding protein [Mycena venus]|uniref:NAD-binding protein n=1 Tax=Mycena venus TaxID=2733690 RepID=A0A8H6WXG2_9AGAR|nr:NAD-binding protein [Mycena venus]